MTRSALGANEQEIAAFVAPDVAIAPQVALTGDYQLLVDVPITYANLGGEQDMAMSVYATSNHGLTPEANGSLHGTTGSLAGTFHWPPQLTTGTRVVQSYPQTEPDKEIVSWAPIASNVLLRVPGGTASWTQILGAGGFHEAFSGLIAGSPSGSISKVFSPGIPL